MTFRALLGIGVALAVTALNAQESPAPPPAEQSSAPVSIPPLRIFAESENYPAGLAARGIQGTVLVLATLSPEGRFTNPSIQSSSRSEELDAAALALANRMRFQPEAPGEKIPATAVAEIDFRKDSSTSLRIKTCADFNLDAEYFKAKFAEKSLLEMPVFEITTGFIGLAAEADQRVAILKNLDAIKERVIAECKQTPADKFLELALTAANDLSQ